MRYALLVFLVGCGTGSVTAPPDLAVAADDLAVAADLGAADLGPPDLLPPVDNELCANLHLAVANAGSTNDCAAEYLARFVRCFQPAGACTHDFDQSKQRSSD